MKSDSLRGDLRAKALNSNVMKCYLVRIGGASLALATPVFNRIWEMAELSLTDVMLLQALFSICVAISQVPTGYLADRMGRKTALVSGAALMALGNFIYAFSNSFGGFLSAEILLAIGISLMFGADEALLFETLKELGRQSEFVARWGTAGALSLLAIAAAAAIGSVIAIVDIKLPLQVSTLILLVVFCLTLTFEEPERSKLVGNGWRVVLRDMEQAVVLCFQDPKLRWLTILSTVFLAFNNAGLWLYQPYMKLTELPVILCGVAFAVFSLTAAYMSQRAEAIGKYFGQYAMGILPISLIAASYILLGSISGIVSIGFVLLQQSVRGYLPVLISRAVNEQVDDSLRATIASVRCAGERMVYAAVIVPLGSVADIYGVPSAFLTLGILTLAIGTVCLALFLPRLAVPEQQTLEAEGGAD